MKVDWDELSAEFQQSNDRSFTEVERADAQRRFVRLMLKNFDAILAERSAAENLYDKTATLYDYLLETDEEGLIHHATQMRDVCLAVHEYRSADPSFDKEPK